MDFTHCDAYMIYSYDLYLLLDSSYKGYITLSDLLVYMVAEGVPEEVLANPSEFCLEYEDFYAYLKATHKTLKDIQKMREMIYSKKHSRLISCVKEINLIYRKNQAKTWLQQYYTADNSLLKGQECFKIYCCDIFMLLDSNKKGFIDMHSFKKFKKVNNIRSQ